MRLSTLMFLLWTDRDRRSPHTDVLMKGPQSLIVYIITNPRALRSRRALRAYRAPLPPNSSFQDALTALSRLGCQDCGAASSGDAGYYCIA